MTVATERTIYAEYGRTLIIRPAADEDANALFEKVCADFDKHTRIEQDCKGNIYIMPPTGGESSDRNLEIGMQLRIWAKRDGRGRSTDSNGEYILPDGSKFAPDAAWVSKAKLKTLSKEERRKFLKLVPEFVIELKSPTDRMSDLEDKMAVWMRNGVELSWLIDPDQQRVLIYREPNSQGKDELEVVSCDELTADGPVEGFVLDLVPIWCGLGDL
jgi:Uma2 family endonuclease